MPPQMIIHEESGHAAVLNALSAFARDTQAARFAPIVAFLLELATEEREFIIGEILPRIFSAP